MTRECSWPDAAGERDDHVPVLDALGSCSTGQKRSGDHGTDQGEQPDSPGPISSSHSPRHMSTLAHR